MQKHVNLVDLVKSFPTNIYLQNLASIQKRTSPVKFAHLAEKSGKGSISNLSTKMRTSRPRRCSGTAIMRGSGADFPQNSSKGMTTRPPASGRETTRQVVCSLQLSDQIL